MRGHSAERALFVGIVGACCSVWIWLVLVEQQFDWELFASMGLADLAGWIHERRIPTWSYLLCGGAPRLADPQSFAASPLFIVIYLFGPILGTKVLCLLSMVVGLWSLIAILSLWDEHIEPERRLATFEKAALAGLFFLSEFFLWRLVVGHMTFIVAGFGMSVVFWSVRAARGPLTGPDYLKAALCGWLFFSSGFFATAAYLLFPVLTALLGVVVGQLVRSIGTPVVRAAWCRVGRLVLVGAVMVAPSTYRLAPVVRFQAASPRTMPTSWDTSPKAASFLAFQLLPTFGPGWADPAVLSGTDHRAGPWLGIWEDANFSVAPWLVGVLLVVTMVRGRGRSDRQLLAWCIAVVATSCALALGRFASWAPFTLINIPLQDSLRLSQRFGTATTFGTVLLAQALAVQDTIPARLRKVIITIAAGGMIVGTAFFIHDHTPRSIGPALAANFRPVAIPERIRALAVASHPDHQSLAELEAGTPVLNCYFSYKLRTQPADRIGWAQHELWLNNETDTLLPFVQPSAGLPQACLENSYLEPGGVHIDPSCPDGTCMAIGWLDPDDPIGARLKLRGQYYCLQQPGA